MLRAYCLNIYTVKKRISLMILKTSLLLQSVPDMTRMSLIIMKIGTVIATGTVIAIGTVIEIGIGTGTEIGTETGIAIGTAIGIVVLR